MCKLSNLLLPIFILSLLFVFSCNRVKTIVKDTANPTFDYAKQGYVKGIVEEVTLDGCTWMISLKDSADKRIEPDVMELEIKLGKQLNKLETWNSEENQKLYDEVGGPVSCGGVPFFYNKNTKQSICGAMGIDAMIAWAVVNNK